ncbi:MAG TPA: pyrimidine utilization protein A [Alphaproteobacteria bacterium]|nr:pyrimidine utilization protein A [Alphaproteobacteria bacterium]
MEIGVFLPIGNNGWLISETSPQYKPTWDLNRTVAQKAEAFGFDFALSMIKLRGFGGPSQYWDYNLESFTLMAGLAAVTERLKLFATAAVLTLPPAIVARMAVTIDSIAPGRFGVNVVTGWQHAEYSQMGLWPGDEHFAHRYDYCAEYVQVMRELWSTGRSDLKGRFFTMDDCRLLPMPSAPVEIISAGQSDSGMGFAAEHADYNFLSGGGENEAAGLARQVARLNAATAKTGRNVKALALIMIIADETDEAAQAKWEHYKRGTDHEALAWRDSQAGVDKKADALSTAGRMLTEQHNLPTNIARFVGSYETVAAKLDELAEVEGLTGVMLTFDDFIIGMEQFGRRIQPLMRCRNPDVRHAA